VRPHVAIAGIVNVTEDSFSDGGRWLDPSRAVEHALALVEAGADVIELGAASSRPDATPVPPDEERRRLDPVLDALLGRVRVGVDSFATETQRHVLARGVSWLNDIQGFPDPALHPALAASNATLVVMHSIQRRGIATRAHHDASRIVGDVVAFFRERVAALTAAGVARERIVLDPGMGFFVGRDPGPSLALLRAIPRLRQSFGLPVLVSVSRKSFLGQITGRRVPGRGPATLAAELYAARQGVDWVRTHDVAALRDALAIWSALEEETE